MGTVAAFHWNSSLKYQPWDRMSSFSSWRLLLPRWKTHSWQCQQEPQGPQAWAVLGMQSQGLNPRPKTEGLHPQAAPCLPRTQPDPLHPQLAFHTPGHGWIVLIHPKGTTLLTLYSKWRPSNSLAFYHLFVPFSVMPSFKDILLFPRSKCFPFCFHFIEKCFPYWLKLLLFLKGTQSSSKWSKAWFFKQWEASRKRTMSNAGFSLFSDIRQSMDWAVLQMLWH